MIEILSKKRKRFFITVVILLFIVTGVNLYFFINLFNIFDVQNYKINDDFTVDYDEGYGGVNVNFHISHRYFAEFDSLLIFRTISSANIEEIGITEISYDVYSDNILVWFYDFDYTSPITFDYISFVIGHITQYANISCFGTIKAQFNVEGIIQNETIPFILSIIMPVNPLEIRDIYLMNLIWVEYGLGILLIVFVGSIFKTIQILRREVTYKHDEIKRDKEFWDYIDDKLDQFKKESFDKRNKK